MIGGWSYENIGLLYGCETEGIDSEQCPMAGFG